MQFVRQQMIILIIVFLTSSCIPATSSNNPSVNRIIYGLTDSFTGIDPHIHYSDELGIVLRQIYDTLVYRHPDTDEIISGLAESWEISEDRTVYTFYLRENVTFHDGSVFDAQAVADNLQRILNPNLPSEKSRQLLGPIVSYQVLDAYTIRLRLNHPFEPLLDSLSQPYLGIASPVTLNSYQETPLRYQFHQVGTGAYQLIEYIPEDRIVLRRNPRYQWQPDFYNTSDNTIEEIEFRFYRDINSRLSEVVDGNVEIMENLLPSDARSLSNNPDITTIPVSIPGNPIQFYFNTTIAPTDDTLIRQSLVYAANRTSVSETIYGGFASVAWGPLSANNLYYNRGVRNVYAYNLQQARSLIAQAGYTLQNGVLTRDGEKLSITLVHSPDDQLSQVSQFLAEQWESIGFDVRVRPVPSENAVREVGLEEEEYHLLALYQTGYDPQILNRNYLSTMPENWSRVSNPELDAILLEAEQMPTSDERRLAYGRAQAIVLEQALVLPLTDIVRLTAHTERIENLRYDVYGFPILYNVSLRNQ